MNPDDPRHGSPAGAMQHYRDGETSCDPCRLAKNRAHKINKFRRDNGDHGHIPHAHVRAAVTPWLAMGYSATAIFRAAGCAQHYGGNAFYRHRAARRDTYQALLSLTEEQFADSDLVYADLTRKRIYSLRAAGHSLLDMPIDPQGVWRDATQITIGAARAVRAFFQANEMVVGSNRNGAARARNQGHEPPLSWDDPGTLAWPVEPTPVDLYAAVFADSDVDPVVVMRLLEGERIPSTRAEKDAAMGQWVADGGSQAELCRWHGWKEGRYGRLRPVADGAA